MSSLFKLPLQGSAITAATTILIPLDGDRFDVSGTTPITAIQTNARGLGARFYLRFEDAVTLTHAPTLQLRAESNYTTTPGDILRFEVTGTNQVRQLVLANETGITAGREFLTAPRTYYVATDGSDSNSGLTPETPFATIQKAIDVASTTLDNGGHDVTIQLADGVYSENVVLKNTVGNGVTVILGNMGTPGNVVIEGVVGGAPVGGLKVDGTWKIHGLRLDQPNDNFCIYIEDGTKLIGDLIEFAGAGAFHVLVANSAVMDFSSKSYSIVGDAGSVHGYANGGGVLNISSATIDIVGSRAFPNGLFAAETVGIVKGFGLTITGSFTGPEYNVFLNGVFASDGASIPGSAPGNSSTGGQHS